MTSYCENDLYHGSDGWSFIDAETPAVSAAQRNPTEENREKGRLSNKKIVGQLCRTFLEDCTLHGFHFCFDDIARTRRALWTLVVIGTMCLFTDKLINDIRLYYQYPFNTVMVYEMNQKSVAFPAVSICNKNDWKMSVLNGTELDSSLKVGVLPDTMSGEEIFEMLSNAAHNVTDLIYECKWKKTVPCDYRNFTAFQSTEGDTCFTFNLPKEGGKPLRVDRGGPDTGLVLTLNVETFDYYWDRYVAGVTVILHDQNELPASMSGVSVKPGYTTYMQLEQTQIHNLKPPYKTACGNPPLKYFDTYSRSKCYLDTLTQTVVNKCGCREWFMPGKEVDTCNLTMNMECMWPEWLRFSKNIKRNYYDKCPVSCNFIEYSSIMSYAMFPSNSYADEWAKRENIRGKTIEQKRKFLRENFLEVNIYYDELNYYKITQVASYDEYSLLCDIGGQMGLFLGASTLTFMEFFDLIFIIVLSLYKNSKEDEEVPQSELYEELIVMKESQV